MTQLAEVQTVGSAFGPDFASGNDEDAIVAITHEIFLVEEANEFSKEECLSFGGDLERLFGAAVVSC
ncbi:hypothetical protein Natoc_1260 [Natronococcus occultus SP4]|uniref:Uncharacterized protein n=1 Tax=Natronococcus occultus SP4 TaxID=694430 RepID=L0JYZ1_9EURY|nr:hypothetical protein Natoc_1260 [Natronococcus occultus SP4]